MQNRIKHACWQTLLVSLVLVSFTTSSFSQESDTQIAEAAQKALSTQMGEASKDLQVQVVNGDAKLRGWVKGPKDVKLAAYIVSTVPGVVHAYSSGVHTWTATDHN
ncbi:hypothetical protein DIC66_22360 [Rhodoferax lacus]|uniref:BON domain-containing protein n=1 Tax=Rhodoferax lacus TaxID=2184758 RepID=A0A3E1R5P2_9BURK|nr:hypothetical protein DIC66_22360 [Rhodoferax lacus]